MTEAMPFLQKYDITFLRPPTIRRRLRSVGQKMSVSALPRLIPQGYPVHGLIGLPAEIFRLLPKLLPGGWAGQDLVRPDGRA